MQILSRFDSVGHAPTSETAIADKAFKERLITNTGTSTTPADQAPAPVIIGATPGIKSGENVDHPHYTDSPHALQPGNLTWEGLVDFARTGPHASPRDIASAIFHPDTRTYFIGESHQGPPFPAVVALIDRLKNEGHNVTIGIEMTEPSLALQYIIDDLMTGGIQFRDKEPTEEEWSEIEATFVERFLNYRIGSPSAHWDSETIEAWERARVENLNKVIPVFILARRTGVEDLILYDPKDGFERDRQGNFINNRDEGMHEIIRNWRNENDDTLVVLTGGVHAMQVETDEPRYDHTIADFSNPLAARKREEVSGGDLTDPTIRTFYMPPLPTIDDDGNALSRSDYLLHMVGVTPYDYNGVFPVETFNGDIGQTPPIVPYDERGVPVPNAVDLMLQGWTQPRTPQH